jgi:hypothetical protein
MSTTHKLKLPLIHSGQAQKEITHNEALCLLDVLINTVIQDIFVNKPPLEAALGELYIIGENPIAEFANHPNKIAQKLESGWRFITAPKWLIATIDQGGSRYTYSGKIWLKLSESNPAAFASAALPQVPIQQIQVQNDYLIKQDNGEYLQVVHLQEELEVKGGAYAETKIKIPHHSVLIAVNIRVIKAIQGASSFSVGTDEDKSRYGSGLSSSQDTTNVGLTNHPMTYWYDKPIRITADNGSFSGGLVKITLQILKPHGPWNWD